MLDAAILADVAHILEETESRHEGSSYHNWSALEPWKPIFHRYVAAGWCLCNFRNENGDGSFRNSPWFSRVRAHDIHPMSHGIHADSYIKFSCIHLSQQYV